MFNKFIANILPYFPKKIVWLVSKNYIAGDKLEDAIRVSKELNAQNTLVTIDLLGEFIDNLDEASENKKQYLTIIEETTKAGIKGNYSVKPSMFGLLLDTEVCYTNIREIVKTATQYNNFVRLDMEDSPCTDLEIDLYKRLREEFPTNVGLVFQSYMRRTHSDLEKLFNEFHPQNTPNNYRLCKGIYVEPKEIAYKDYDEINQHYLKNLEFLLKNGEYVGIATHDKYLVENAYKLLEKYNVPKDKYEFQMLYGVTPALRKSIIDKGHKMRVYVPFGKDWFGYSTRRLKENPKMTNHIIKAFFHKG
jgi:proline dehydrogenase